MIQDFFHNASQNFLTVFKGRNLFWHLLAIALTAALVLSGADWWYFEHTRSTDFYWIVAGAGLGGFAVPILGPAGVYIWGMFRGSARVRFIAAATLQASALGYIISTLYKIVTGRTQPSLVLDQVAGTDISHAFHFGLFQNGVFWGWPSSHAATAFAGAVCLTLLIKNKPLRIAAIVYALFVGIGASIGFHWLSDVVAGTILGILVGVIVARSYSALVKTTSTV